MENFFQGNEIRSYIAPKVYGMVPGPSSAYLGAAEALIPTNVFAAVDSFQAKDPVNSESGLSYVGPNSRKRSCDDSVDAHCLLPFPLRFDNLQPSDRFLGENFSSQMQQHLLEIDYLLQQHNKKVRMEMEEKRKINSRRMMAALEERIAKRLRAKEEEIERIGRLNWALEERVRSLCIENQIWKELAHTNEATANALRGNLEQVMAQFRHDQQRRRNHHGRAEEDAESCCSSTSNNNNNNSETEEERRRWWCINCRKEEASLLVLPCRHLCMCYACGHRLERCPLCNSAKSGCIHVDTAFSIL